MSGAAPQDQSLEQAYDPQRQTLPIAVTPPPTETAQVGAPPPSRVNASDIYAQAVRQMNAALDKSGGSLEGQATAPAVPVDKTFQQRFLARPQGLDATSAVSSAVLSEESGGRQYDPKTGKVLTSSAGARGVGQLMPATAAGLGVDPDKQIENVAGHELLLERLYKQYSNWPQALAAYQAGPEALAKAGGDISKMSQGTQRYVSDVMYKSGLGDDPGSSLVSLKRQSLEDNMQATGERYAKLAGLDQKRPDVISAAEPSVQSPFTGMGEPGSELTGEPPDELKAFWLGAMKGVSAVPGGQAQAVGSQVAPGVTQDVTKALQRWEGQYDEPAQQHPNWAYAGKVLGETVSLAAEAGLLKPVAAIAGAATGATAGLKAIAQAVPRLFRWGTAAGAAGAITATGYEQEPEQGLFDLKDRAINGAVGAALGGTLGYALGGAVAQKARSAADAAELQRQTGKIKEALGDFAPAASGLKASIDRRVEQARLREQDLLTARNVQGQRIEGFSSTGLKGVIDDVVKNIRARGEAITPQTNTAIARLSKELGLGDEEAQLKAYGEAIEKWRAEVNSVDARRAATAEKLFPGFSKLSPGAKQQFLTQSESMLPQRPAAPTFQPGRGQVSAAQYSAGRSALGQSSTAVKSPTARKQISEVKQAVEKQAVEEARKAGVSTKEFLRRSAKADAFREKTLDPLEEMTRGDWQSLSTAEVFDRAIKVVESGDPEKIKALKAVVGTTGVRHLRDGLLYRIMTVGQEGERYQPGKIADYIQEHKGAIQSMFGREADEVFGMSKIAQQVATEVEKAAKAGHGPLGRSLRFSMSGWLGIIGLEHMIRGDVAKGAEYVLSGVLAHTLYHNAVTLLHMMPEAMPVVRRAAKLRPDSVELNRLVDNLGYKYARNVAIVTRLHQEAGTQQRPLQQPQIGAGALPAASVSRP